MKTDTLLMLAAGGALVYWLSTQNAAATATPSSSTSPAPGASPTGGSPGAVTPANSPAPAASAPPSTSAPVYSGPSLAQMFQALLAAVQADASNPAITCGVGTPSNLSGVGAVETNAPRTSTTSVIASRSIPLVNGGVVRNTPRVSPSGPCANPIGTYDDFNWYLVNRANVGITSAPNPPDHTSQITLTDYWAWAAPLLQQQIPGLSGVRTLRIPLYGGWA